MNSPLITPTFDSASRLTRAVEGRQLGLAAKALAICTLLLGLSPFVSWASEPFDINLASVEVFAESLQGEGLAKKLLIIEYPETHVFLSTLMSWRLCKASAER
tara:strand:- start:46 stop:354 length:309 start_codon:yes stop_codon:yes gene_type:complete